MAESKNNIITHGLSGKVGDLIIFSQRNGKTIVSKVPQKADRNSTKQLEHQQKFQKAVLYAKNALLDPSLKEVYTTEAAKKDGITPYNIAVADLLNAPKIEKIDLSSYTGKKGDLIKVQVYDDYKVEQVSVHIYNQDGSLVEEGTATPQGLDWVYTTKANNEELSGDKIIIRATDTPANLVEQETLL
ncbi:hypothetical protein [Riemerella anatipestifer]|uniref:hypothetical protein n=1 Tax=Riemerella anatipestifer TaxID=34085 RepID=UPI00208F7F35|nr:hypothetical protein [Riemerella anatipestifer]MCO4305008.1 hypothetical protein [Riemerella anatipestifer]MCO7353888.1 hypothetical protein [Riemerella anatipestifer]MCQ4040404.1 hypothetical protein [Riemerella anatipestifer]MCT6762006.1 hypothetical protein [Riemerella anatipestifer]MCT6768117.1 hypothetical protein [Riemerella anatipestifer]